MHTIDGLDTCLGDSTDPGLDIINIVAGNRLEVAFRLVSQDEV